MTWPFAEPPSGCAVSTASRRLPAHVRFPLQRDGLDPVPRAGGEPRPGRRGQPLLRLLGTTVWLVTGYDAARAVLADSDAFANDVRHLVGRQDRAPAERIGGLGMTDPPDHDRLRGVLTPHFTRRRLADLQDDIDRVVEAALDDLAAHGPEVDLVARFGFAVPFGVICDLLGIPDVDREEFRERGAARFDLRDGGAGILDTAAGTRQFLIDLVASERRAPHLPDGLVSRMVAEHGADFDDVELGGLADGVFLGGYETSATCSRSAPGCCCSTPRVEDAARGDPDDVDRVVEELLRFVCPVQIAFPRIARRDLMVGEQAVRAGDVVVVSLTGAGRDPARHVDPAALRPDHGLRRDPRLRPRAAPLRRRRAGPDGAADRLVGLARRFPDLSLACDPADLRFTELAIVHGVEALPVRLGDSHGRTLERVACPELVLAAAVVACRRPARPTTRGARPRPRRPPSGVRRPRRRRRPPPTPSADPTPEPPSPRAAALVRHHPRDRAARLPRRALPGLARRRTRHRPPERRRDGLTRAAPRGGVGPGEVGNLIVTGAPAHRHRSPALLALAAPR